MAGAVGLTVQAGRVAVSGVRGWAAASAVEGAAFHVASVPLTNFVHGDLKNVADGMGDASGWAKDAVVFGALRGVGMALERAGYALPTSRIMQDGLPEGFVPAAELTGKAFAQVLAEAGFIMSAGNGAEVLFGGEAHWTWEQYLQAVVLVGTMRAALEGAPKVEVRLEGGKPVLVFTGAAKETVTAQPKGTDRKNDPENPLSGDLFPESKDLSEIVRMFVADQANHRMDIVRHLQTPAIRPIAIETLKGVVREGPVSQADLERAVTEALASPNPIFRTNDLDLSTFQGQKRFDLLRNHLRQANPELFCIGENPSVAQELSLIEYVEGLAKNAQPSLQSLLDGVAGRGEGFFPMVGTRTKSPEGVLDKISRMRMGNDGKAPRPDYDLSAMPDIVGGRIIVTDPAALTEIMVKLEEALGNGAIFEKENFYSSPGKRNRPYRVITYGAVIQGAPVEIQVVTLQSGMLADLNHNTNYKPILPVTDQQKALISDMFRAGTVIELRKLGK